MTTAAQTRALAHYSQEALRALQERPFTWSGLPALLRSPTYRDSWTVEELRAVMTTLASLIRDSDFVDSEACIEALDDAADAADEMSLPSDEELARDADARAAESRAAHRREMAEEGGL